MRAPSDVQITKGGVVGIIFGSITGTSFIALVIGFHYYNNVYPEMFGTQEILNFIFMKKNKVELGGYIVILELVQIYIRLCLTAPNAHRSLYIIRYHVFTYL
ncbi:hypothetical protein C1645_842696 [Glomus cerebriforme]|uniref:Uncharacterized protein n=1 Tax=Glomus cerebriforme TaxID=658196 RepID=A0A397S3Y3_9GLOM|nr:hypothetical protein C1645_842696 [Glomus cerebriforme]